jgi:hypothetical protein
VYLMVMSYSFTILCIFFVGLCMFRYILALTLVLILCIELISREIVSPK